ncbi:MAG TPA: DUF416 family protein [Acidobacteriaceae bacterium]|nr:DUF416 family protein [Acidobacteriaceae bacterium]
MVSKERIPDFDSWLSELPDRLLRYPAPHIQLFIASCCERQQSNYAAFAQHVHWGDPTLLREAGNILWAVHESLSDSYVRAIAKALVRATPAADEFDSPLTPAAQEAAASLQQGLEFLTDPDPQRGVTVCALVRDAIYLTVERSATSSTAFAAFLKTAELEIQELLQQESDLYILSQFHELTTKFIDRFRQCASPQGRSNLGLHIQ